MWIFEACNEISICLPDKKSQEIPTMNEHEEWLNLVAEQIIEPDLPICDSHHHLIALEGQRYLVADFVKDASGGHNIRQSVVVQTKSNYEQGSGGGMSPVDETVFVMKQIEGRKLKIDVAAGFVGYADLATGRAVQKVLEAHLEVGKKRFKGIRYYIPKQSHALWQSTEPAAPSILSDSRFLEGFAFLPKYKLTYDLPVGMSQFPELIDLAKRFPNTPMIISSLGWPMLQTNTPPEKKEEAITEWRRRIKMVTPVDNIYIKLGGTGIPQRGFGFDKKSMPPNSEEIVKVVGTYYQFVIEQLGPKRCMFGSNFPPEKIYSNYTVIWNAFKLMTKSFSKTERASMLHDTANQVYNL
jgi:L-fuconolactonase